MADAKKNDYEIDVNNDDQNVTIRCSTGFYVQVAKPCFSTLETRTVITKAGIAVVYDDLKTTIDKTY